MQFCADFKKVQNSWITLRYKFKKSEIALDIYSYALRSSLEVTWEPFMCQSSQAVVIGKHFFSICFRRFLFFSYYIQHCFICRPSDFIVPTDAGNEPRTVATVHWQSLILLFLFSGVKSGRWQIRPLAPSQNSRRLRPAQLSTPFAPHQQGSPGRVRSPAVSLISLRKSSSTWKILNIFFSKIVYLLIAFVF